MVGALNAGRIIVRPGKVLKKEMSWVTLILDQLL